MRILDLPNDKLVMRDAQSDGVERTVAFLEYREHPEESRVVTGVIESLPHLDIFTVGERLLNELRSKYPRGEWSLETEPTWCRPEYLALIQRGIEEGFDYYDVIGEVVDGPVDLTEDWQFDENASVESSESHPSRDLLAIMKILDAEIDS